MNKILKRAVFALALCITTVGFAQSVGDTIVVKTLNFNSGVRDTVVSFPNNSSLTFEKVIMQYSMRCKNAQVSTGTDRNKGCGEWDYSCNTYITDSAHIDSAIYYTPDYSISGFSGTFYNYTNGPTNTYYQNIQQSVVINSTISDTASVLGTGTKSLTDVLQTALEAGKSQYLFTQSELSAAGVHAGNIDALALTVANLPQVAKLFRVRIKSTAKTTLSSSEPDLTGFTEVYSYDFAFSLGANRIQFHTPFAWNGTSNLIVEFTFKNQSSTSAMVFSGDSLSTVNGISTAGEDYFEFDGSNYIEADNYRGVGGDTSRTIEAWIKTSVGGKEIVSWGTNSAGQKYLLRLDGAGKLRMEAATGNAVGTSLIADGQWHHVAVIQNGPNTTNASLYVDGVQETISSSTAYALNTGNAFKVRISRGIHNLYWDGQIAEVRIWKTALSQTDLQNWMYKSLDATHPDYSDLTLYYPLNEDSGTTINDASGNGRNATVVNATIWSKFNGIDHFKSWSNTVKRPNTTFYQGNYNLTIVTDTILDTIQNPANIVSAYQVYPKYGSTENDSIGLISQTSYWEATAEEVYGPTGLLVSTIFVPTSGSISIGSLPYFRRSPSKFEIMSFVTPYGIGLDLGVDGETWTYDVTDFTPFLKGNKRMTVERGGQWQEELDITFLFIVGTPPRDVIDIQQIWPVDKKSYVSINADDSFEPRDVMMNPLGEYFKIRSTITGHGQQGEFTARNHTMNLDGGSIDFAWQVWKACALNPVYPQGGTWVYDRAGWCPGMSSDTEEMDITQSVTPGQSTEIDYNVIGGSGTSDYIVNNQLVTYGAANFALDAAIIDFITPSAKIEYARTGSICDGPVVRIQNTGSTNLTSLTISYWVNNASTPQTYTWTGVLGFLETADVTLPNGTVWDDLTPSGNMFYAELSAPNGGTDGYAYNNKYSQEVAIPEVMPNDFYVSFRTNNAGNENRYEVLDEYGNTILSRSGMSNNTLYSDTLHLGNGCYTFKVYDTDGDGIAWWANNDGTGYVRLRRASNNSTIIQFNPDFGGEINFPFTVNFPLSYEELHPVLETSVYPNPATNRVIVEMKDAAKAAIDFYSNTGQLLRLPRDAGESTVVFNTSGLSQGVYYVRIELEGNVSYEKVVVLN